MTSKEPRSLGKTFSFSQARLTALDFSRIGILTLLMQVIVFSGIGVWSQTSFASSLVDVELSRIGDATHIEFSGLADWRYHIERRRGKSGDIVKVRINPLIETAVDKLEGWTDSLIKRVEVKKNMVNRDYELHFYVRSGKVATFDYITDKPSGLVLDFFEQNKKIKAPKKVVAKRIELPTELPEKKKVIKGVRPRIVSLKRKPAATEFLKDQKFEPVEVPLPDKAFGIFDAGDPKYSRFRVKDYEINEDAIIASQKNIFIEFPLLVYKSDYLQRLWKNPPIYQIETREGEENKIAQLLYTLYDNKRNALFLKTLKFFSEKFPDSEYNELIYYMAADVYYRLWQETDNALYFEQAMARYAVMIENYPNSTLTERTHLLIGFSYLYRGDNFSSLKSFRKFLINKPNSKHRDRIKLAMVESFVGLGRYKDALKMLTDVERTGRGIFRVQARYRRGDVFIKQRKLDQAVDEYLMALKKFPDFWDRFPNMFFNLAEAKFLSKKYRESINAHIEFLRRFPAHEIGALSMTRIGEIMGILGVNPKRSLGAYMESFFRYKGTLGAEIAQMRILSERMNEMKASEVEEAIEKIRTLGKTGKVDRLHEFSTLMIADGLYQRKEYLRVRDTLVDFYQQSPLSRDLPTMKSRIVRSIITMMSDYNSKKSYLKTLELYFKHRDDWLKDSDRIDLLYNVGLAYEKAKIYEEADEVYRKAANRLYALKGTKAERARSIFEVLPTGDEINLRLASIAVAKNDFKRTYRYLSSIQQKSKLSDQGKIEYTEISAKLAENKGNNELARRFLTRLIKTWRGQPELVAPIYIKLAKIRIKQKRLRAAQTLLKNVQTLDIDSPHVPKETLFEGLNLLAETTERLGQKKRATEIYRSMIEKFDGKHNLDPIRFKLGKLYHQLGNKEQADEQWTPLLEQESVWAKLILQEQKETEWNDKYKEVKDRIPAMEGFRE